MINQMQIITHLPLNNVQMPQNAKDFYLVILDMANFNIVPSEDILNVIFNIHDTYPLNDNFDEMDIF